MNRDVLPNPIIVVGRANRERVAVEDRWHTHRRLPAVRESIKTNSLRINKRKRLQPIQNLFVLRNDHREQRFPKRIRFTLQHSKWIASAIGVMRGKSNKTAFRQPSSERFVWSVATGIRSIDRIARHSFQAMLANDHRPFLVRL